MNQSAEETIREFVADVNALLNRVQALVFRVEKLETLQNKAFREHHPKPIRNAKRPKVKDS